MKIGKPVNKKLERLLQGVFDSNEIIEIEYKIKCTRSKDGCEFYNQIKVTKNDILVKKSSIGSDYWESVKTGKQSGETRYDCFGDSI